MWSSSYECQQQERLPSTPDWAMPSSHPSTPDWAMRSPPATQGQRHFRRQDTACPRPTGVAATPEWDLEPPRAPCGSPRHVAAVSLTPPAVEESTWHGVGCRASEESPRAHPEEEGESGPSSPVRTCHSGASDSAQGFSGQMAQEAVDAAVRKPRTPGSGHGLPVPVCSLSC